MVPRNRGQVRQQTQNRNLASNTLKVFFHQLRNKYSETYKSLKKIIQANGIRRRVDTFIRKLNKDFPLSKTYISIDDVRKACHNREDDKSRENGLILRASLKRFFQY